MPTRLGAAIVSTKGAGPNGYAEPEPCQRGTCQGIAARHPILDEDQNKNGGHSRDHTEMETDRLDRKRALTDRRPAMRQARAREGKRSADARAGADR